MKGLRKPSCRLLPLCPTIFLHKSDHILIEIFSGRVPRCLVSLSLSLSLSLCAMDDHSEDELSAWEILPDADFASLSPPQSSRNDGNAGFTDECSDVATPKSHRWSINPTLKSSEIQDNSEDNASMVSSEPVDPCLETCLRESVTDRLESGDETLEKSEGTDGDVDGVPKEERRVLGIALGRDVSIVEGATAKERGWWKLPLELITASVLRVKPLWSLSLGVVAIGVILLGRRWYKVKGKPRSLPAKISFEQKKVSQLMIQARRRNEALPIVRHVTSATRASLLPADATPWSLIGLK